jgi:hypothetical protein
MLAATETLGKINKTYRKRTIKEQSIMALSKDTHTRIKTHIITAPKHKFRHNSARFLNKPCLRINNRSIS